MNNQKQNFEHLIEGLKSANLEISDFASIDKMESVEVGSMFVLYSEFDLVKIEKIELILDEKFRFNAKNLPKTDPYFSKINCIKSCDNWGMNLEIHKRLDELKV